MSIPEISVIIPCYNVAELIARCIHSLSEQKLSDFEIIAVDDGSKDKTLSVLKKLAESEPRLRVVSQPNSGASSARNRGLDEAMGKWATFVDADDYVSADYLSDFIGVSDLGSADLVLQGATIIDARSGAVMCDTYQPGRYDIPDGIVKCRSLHRGYSWGKLYRMDIIKENKLRFDNAISYKEDLLFMLSFLKYATAIVATDAAGYIYERRAESLSTRLYHPGYIMDINDVVLNSQTVSMIGELAETMDYISEYKSFCIAETIDAMYRNSLDQESRRMSFNRLSTQIGQAPYPRKFKSDLVQSFFFRMGMFRFFDILERKLRKMRK